MTVTLVSPALLVLLTVAICGVILLARRVPFVGRALVACTVLALVGFLLFAGVYRLQVSRRPSVVPGQLTVAEVDRLRKSPPVAFTKVDTRKAVVDSSVLDWSKADHFPASVYSSRDLAWNGISTQILERLLDLGRPGNSRVSIEMIDRASDKRGRPSRRDLSRAVPLRQWLTERGWNNVTAKYVTGPERNALPIPPPPDVVAVSIVHESTTRDRGRFVGNLSHPDLTTPQHFEARYTNKPWVRQDVTGGRIDDRYIVGRSGLEAKPSRAFQIARDHAVEQVVGLVHSELERRHLAPADRAAIHARAHRAARSFVDSHIADQFPQDLQTDHVTVHRNALRVVAYDHDVHRLADEILGVARSARVGLFRQFGAMGVLGVFIFLAYLFLNAGTKGHFAWKLRTFSASAFAAMCWAIHHFGLFS